MKADGAAIACGEGREFDRDFGLGAAGVELDHGGRPADSRAT